MKIHKRKKSGFTLLEIMIVLVIIGILGALVAPKMSQYMDDSKVKGASLEINSLSNALQSYFSRNGEYPSRLFAVKDYFDNMKLSEQNRPLDPWGNPYFYKTSNNGGVKNQYFFLKSAGPDQIMDTNDDITKSSGGAKRNEGESSDEFDESIDSELEEEL